MAEVHRAWGETWAGKRGLLALKMVLPHYNKDTEFLHMLEQEAHITCLLDHDNIARTFEFGRVGDAHYLAMEYVEGVDLRGLMRACRRWGEPPPIEHVLRIGIGALRGLHAAHVAVDRGGEPLHVVHRDISPANILLGYDGSVKVCDFGIAKAATSERRTRFGVVKGKTRYMSPEQSAARQLDARSDIFSMGSTLYEALTLVPCFKRDSERATMAAVRSEAVPNPSAVSPGVPAGVDEAILRALAKRRRDRYQTAEEFADVLDGLLYERWPESTGANLGEYLLNYFADRQKEARSKLSAYALDEVSVAAVSTVVSAVAPDGAAESHRDEKEGAQIAATSRSSEMHVDSELAGDTEISEPLPPELD